MLKITQPKLIFCDDDVYERIVDCVGDIKLKCKIVTLGNPIPNVDHVNSFIKYDGKEKFELVADILSAYF
jgi:hypothetical protein